MRKIWTFLTESYGELRKVVWPSWDSVVSSVKVVLVSTVLFAVFFGLVDYLLLNGLYLFF
ncbi:preprotein translocase subunit SecE [Spirochaeta isovalerica]|uniref:Protein translocase subunit SecE n=1 Tax=Spirochaeta isovalerica TaxID=150 RepID=A0A841R9Z9_9SPIO|nr:preprotein translocase subunit SecE [Spirochaeta isovalerica]MBN2657940.1 preprotein translocase subunit SecE [Spirochaetales bacterium]